MRAVSVPPPILTEPKPNKLAEFYPNWPNFTQIGALKTSHGSNFGQMGQNSAKTGGGKLRAFDRFETNFFYKDWMVYFIANHLIVCFFTTDLLTAFFHED
jgi:hypothetical protein